MRPFVIIGIIGICVAARAGSSLPAEDWPTYAHDPARTAVTGGALAVPLTKAWTHRGSRPRPAWPAPAKRDLYNKVYDLEPRMTFDHAYHVAVVGDSLFYGSSATDRIRCLDAETGEPRWTFFTEGPVRLAPTVWKSRVFAGSDDGHVYCLEATSGELVWKHRPGPRDHRVPGNGRMISLWPVRTGVVVQDGQAYACAGVFPWETVYLCAMDAATGRETWKTPMHDLPAQGYLLASARRLYVTTGRDRPVVFETKSGKRLYQVKGGGGGTYALLAGDSLVYGPGKTGQISLFDPGDRDQLAAFDGNHMIVHAGRSYLQSKGRLSALDRVRYLELARERRRLTGERDRTAKELKKLGKNPPADRAAPIRKRLTQIAADLDRTSSEMKTCYLWATDCEQPLSLVLTRGLLVAGGDGQVAAYAIDDGRRVWESKVPGKVHGLAVASGRLYVSTDDGAIHCFEPEGRK